MNAMLNCPKLRFSSRITLSILSIAVVLLAACRPVQPVSDEAQNGGSPQAAPTPAAISTVTPDTNGGLDAGSLARIEAWRAQQSANLQAIEALAGHVQGRRAVPKPPPSAQQAAAPLADPSHPFLILFPELRTAAAPEWLREGTRVTYAVQSASFAANPDDPTPSGAGYLQYDLAALEGDAAYASLTFYLGDGSAGPVSPSFVTVAQGIPGAGDYWISPSVLARAEQVAGPELGSGSHAHYRRRSTTQCRSFPIPGRHG